MELRRKSMIRSLLMALAVAVLCGLSSESAMAQCAMCRASIGSNSAFARNLNIGVLVLLVPPVSIFCTIFVLAFRHRRSS
ncbi:MAG: hypothetical protein QOH71_906 [Blastocatellia bacterium]|jgi:hypothetical protein|nr:hypothetical protein [Blastocatellia bacterium]